MGRRRRVRRARRRNWRARSTVSRSACNAADGPRDDESKRLSDQLARAQELRERLDDLNQQLEALDRQASAEQGSPGQSGSRTSTTPGRNGQPGQAEGASGGGSAELERLRAEIGRQMQEVRELLNQLPRDDRNARMPGGPGSTFEGQGMVLSAPGTEGFKQDFAKWQELKRQATQALDDVETSSVRRLQEKAAKDGWPPASTTRRPPNTSSRSTATSRRWRRGRSPEPMHFASPIPWWLVAALVVAALAGVAFFSYRRPLVPLSRGTAGACWSRCARSRSSVVLLLCFARSSCCRTGLVG